jgi:hypothetical protein
MPWVWCCGEGKLDVAEADAVEHGGPGRDVDVDSLFGHCDRYWLEF